MKKVIFNESAFNAFKRCLVNEIAKPNPYIFGTEKIDYKRKLDDLAKVSNLKVDRYKDYKLEDAYKNWADVGFDKSSNEYKVWCGNLISFLKYLESGIFYVLEDRVKRIGTARPHFVFIDPIWINNVVRDNKEEYQGVYCLILKIYQNKPMWNDLFFNPVFDDLKTAFLEIKKYVGTQIAKNPNIKLLLPIEEYREINMFMRDPGNAKPELFYSQEDEHIEDEPQVEEPNNEPQSDDVDAFDWG